ncbi:MAG: hypothetical protein J1F63_08125 [Oscillospiraceae bacterium]|nr:hypothetical protein [Oscillospiraceae bacterium]
MNGTNKIKEYFAKISESRKIIIVIAIFVTLFSLPAVVTSIIGINTYRNYERYKDSLVPITATVTRVEYEEYVEEGDLGRAGSHYEVYIAYEYNGTIIKDALWKLFNTMKYKPGDTVTIEISSVNPKYIFNGEKGTGWLIFPIIYFGVLIVIFMAALSLFFKDKNSSDGKKPLTEEAVFDYLTFVDLQIAEGTPLIDELFWFRKLFAVIGAGFIFGHIYIPGMFSSAFFIVGAVLALAGIFMQLVWNSVAKSLTKNKYKLEIHVCEKTWWISSEDRKVFYAKFSGIEAPEKYEGVQGNNYYILRDELGSVKRIYDAEEWQNAIEDMTFSHGCKATVKGHWIRMLAGMLLMWAYIGIIAFFV